MKELAERDDLEELSPEDDSPSKGTLRSRPALKEAICNEADSTLSHDVTLAFSGPDDSNIEMDGESIIPRPESNTPLPSGLHDIKEAAYDDHSALVDALRGRQVLVVIMGVAAPQDTLIKIAGAATKVVVTWIMPADFGSDQDNIQLRQETMLGPDILAVRKQIEDNGAGRTHWIGLTSGFWYEFSLSGTEIRYGFDFKNKQVTFFDDSKEQVITTTWPQTGRAYAALLSLLILPEDENDQKLYLSK